MCAIHTPRSQSRTWDQDMALVRLDMGMGMGRGWGLGPPKGEHRLNVW